MVVSNDVHGKRNRIYAGDENDEVDSHQAKHASGKMPDNLSTTTRKKITSAQHHANIDKENLQPNTLVRPNKSARKSKYLKSPSAPKLMLQMEQRQKEREKRREILRSRYEQAAIEKKKLQEEERIQKEEEELRIQRAVMLEKVEIENQKKMAAERWKQACRLAVLHYKMSLQKRLFRQWKRIFDVIAFNTRKVRFDVNDFFGLLFHALKI